MNLKYYLRGLGTGIVVTALIMGIAAVRKEPMSNAEIKERAKALGMVEEENTHLIDLEGQDQDLPEAPAEPEGPEAAREDREPEGPGPIGGGEEGAAMAPEADEPKDAQGDEPAEAGDGPEDVADAQEEPVEPAEDPAGQENDAAGQEENTPEADTQAADSQPGNGSVALTIARGDGSHTVCRKLEESGLIESAGDYDVFLYQNGYDKKIRAGSFEIPEGAGPEEIARIICGIGQ